MNPKKKLSLIFALLFVGVSANTSNELSSSVLSKDRLANLNLGNISSADDWFDGSRNTDEVFCWGESSGKDMSVYICNMTTNALVINRTTFGFRYAIKYKDLKNMSRIFESEHPIEYHMGHLEVLSGQEKIRNEPKLDCWRSTDFTIVLPKDCVKVDMVAIEIELLSLPDVGRSRTAEELRGLFLKNTFRKLVDLEKKQSCVSNELHEAEVHDEIDMAISGITNRLSQTDFDAKTLCEKIARLEDEETQRRYFKRLLDVAYSIHFEDYGDVHATDFDERQRVINRLDFAYHGLESLSIAVWSHYWTRKASQREQFYPLFMYVEKMKIESERRHVQENLCLGGLSVIERIYNVNMKAGNDDPDGFAWVRQNFERLAGRPIRSER